MTNLELAHQYAKEHDECGSWTPFDRMEWRAIELFAKWLDRRITAEPFAHQGLPDGNHLLREVATSNRERKAMNLRIEQYPDRDETVIEGTRYSNNLLRVLGQHAIGSGPFVVEERSDGVIVVRAIKQWPEPKLDQTG